MSKYISLIFLFLSACNLAQDYERPALSLNDQFIRSEIEANKVNLEWWTNFSDPQLVNLIKEALEDNKDILISLAQIEQARAILGITRSNQYPQLNAGLDLNRQGFSEHLNSVSVQNQFGIFGDLSFEVDLWGKLRNATDARKREMLATELNYHSLRLTLISDVANIYFELISLTQQLKIAEKTIKNRHQSTTILTERFKKGVVPELDVEQARIEELDAEARFYELTRQRQNLEHALFVLLGKTPEYTKFVYSTDLESKRIDLPARVPAELLERRPDLLAAEQLLQARLLNVGVAKADRFPTLGLFGTVGQRSIRVEDLDQGDAFTWGISGNLLGPVIDFGKRRSVVELAQAQVIEAKENYEKLALVAVQETENSYTEINTYLKEYEKRTKQIKAASHAALLSRARYDQGFTSYLEVLNIERSLFSAELNSQITYKNYLQSIVRLYKSLGGGWKL